jgi:hypothetical protein
VPALQLCALKHAWLQLPQCDLSLRRSTQEEPHVVDGATHAQTPDTHVWFDPQERPQPPQLRTSRAGSAQIPPSQSSSPDGHGASPLLCAASGSPSE